MNMRKLFSFGTKKLKESIPEVKRRFDRISDYQVQTNRPQIKFMEKKVYGMKPSYKMMKDAMKGYTSFAHHNTNLVYYCIKHDFDEQQVIEYLTQQVDKCEKFLNNHYSGVNFGVEYKYMKDVLNVDMNIFKLQLYRHYQDHYDYENHLWNYDISTIVDNYQYTNNYSSELPEKLFRDYNEHTVYLYDKIVTKNGKQYRGIIKFNKRYEKDKDYDPVDVLYYESISPAGGNPYTLERVKKEFIESCLGLWHFIKLVDCVEHSNDTDVDNVVYKRFETVDKVYDHTEIEKTIYESEQPRIKKLKKRNGNKE